MIKFKKGFTLIELLVVIGILAILMAGVVALINPADKLNAANDATVQSDISNVSTAAQAYASTHNGFYPATMGDMVTSGDLLSTPIPPTGYAAYGFVTVPSPCVAGTTCVSITISATLKSKKYVSAVAPQGPIWKFTSSDGKVCGAATLATACTW